MEIKLYKALVPRRLREELAKQCVKPCCEAGADSFFLQGRNRAAQRAPPRKAPYRLCEGLSQSPLESGGGFGQTL